MKIYFCGSIRGGLQDVELYHELIKACKRFGTVLTEHVGSISVTTQLQGQWTDEEIWQQDMKWLKDCDVVIAECTIPSIGVGYELGIAESLRKPVLCLFRNEPSRLSAMVSGNANIVTKFYGELNEGIQYIEEFLSSN